MSLFSLNGNESQAQPQSSGSLFSLTPSVSAPVTTPVAPAAPVIAPVAKTSLFDTVAALPKTTISQNDGTGIPATDVRARFVAPIGDINPAFRPGRAFVDTFNNASSDLYKRFDDLSATVTNPNSSVADKIAKAGSVGLGIINAGFAGTLIPGILAMGEQIPGVSEVVKGLNTAFTVAGKAGSGTMSTLLDHLNIEDSTREALRPVMQELGGLVAQVVAGGALHEAVKTDMGTLVKKANDIVHSDPRVKLAVESQQGGDTNIPIRTPDINHADYAKSQGYEPYTPPEQLPTIDAGKPAGDLPTIQTEARPITRMGSLSVEPIKPEPVASSVEKPSVPSVAPATIDFASQAKATTPEITRPVLDNGTRVTKASNDVNQTLVEKGFNQLPPEEQAKYTPQTKEEQVQRVSDLMTRDFETARKIVRGEAPTPAGVQEQVLFNAMEEHAVRNGDAVLLRDLAKSPIATRLSEAAQSLGAHGYSDNPNSAVEAIRTIEKAREVKGKSAKVLKSKDIADIKKEVKAVKPKKQTWAEFIKSVQC